MMKKTLLTFLFSLGCTLSLSAQMAPVLDTSWLPQIGDYYEEYESIYFPDDFFNKLRHHKDTGLNITWDFSDMRIEGYPTYYGIFLTPAYCHGNGQANLVEYRGKQLVDTTNMLRFCYIKDNSGLRRTDYISNDTEARGSSNPSYLHEYYSSPYMQVPVPFSYGDTFTDTIYQHSSDRWIDHTVYDTGWMNISISYEGFGILKLPDETYDSVVMIHRKTIIWDTVEVFTGDDNFYVFKDEYEWYHKPDRNLVVYAGDWYWVDPATHDSSFVSEEMETIKSGYYTSILIPAPEKSSNVRAWYSNEHLEIQQLNSRSSYQWQISDVAGKELQNGRIRHSSSATIEPAFTTPGIYLLRITDEKTNTSSTLKIFKP